MKELYEAVGAAVLNGHLVNTYTDEQAKLLESSGKWEYVGVLVICGGETRVYKLKSTQTLPNPVVVPSKPYTPTPFTPTISPYDYPPFSDKIWCNADSKKYEANWLTQNSYTMKK